MALLYRHIMIKAARLVDKGIIDVERNESWERRKIHTIPQVRYIGKGTEELQKMREEIEAENEGVAIPSQVRWLSNPRIIRAREQREAIKESSVVFIVRGKKVAK
jgi:DNA-binding PadR family transcriptional regulator